MDVVLLDFDGTITRQDTTRFLLASILRKRPWRIFGALSGLLRLMISKDQNRIQAAKDDCVGALLKGLSPEELRGSLEYYNRAVHAQIRPEMTALIRDRTASGHSVLVVTASMEIAVKDALKGFPVTVIGTRFEARDNTFTGDPEGEGCYGAAKPGRIHEWAGRQPGGVVFREAWSDAISDLDMMMLASRRFWICPPGDAEEIREQDPQGKMIADMP